MEKIDVWRSANQLIKSYGDKALEKAAARVVELSKSGDEEGMGVWLQISLAICPPSWVPQGRKLFYHPTAKVSVPKFCALEALFNAKDRWMVGSASVSTSSLAPQK
jgi:hypothetical protein